MATTVVLSMIAAIDFLRRAERRLTKSRSTPGNSPEVISTTETLVPRAVYTEPISRPI
jgi:hypothetical protein